MFYAIFLKGYAVLSVSLFTLLETGFQLSAQWRKSTILTKNVLLFNVNFFAFAIRVVRIVFYFSEVFKLAKGINFQSYF